MFRGGGAVVNVGGVTEALALHRPPVVTSPSNPYFANAGMRMLVYLTFMPANSSRILNLKGWNSCLSSAFVMKNERSLY
jgi:hypothetical protein